MHNTSTEYKQMHNKMISWNHNWILIFICFVGRLILDPSTSPSSSFMTSSFLIQMIRRIRSSSRVELFIFLIAWGIFFVWWELDLQLFPSSLLFFLESAESNYFFLVHIPCMNESYDPGRPFKVAITASVFFTSSFTASSCSWFERLLWLHGLCILDLHFLQIKVIFRSMFFPSNILVKESNIIGVFMEDTCSTSWFMTESAMTFLALTKFFLCKDSSLISLWN